MEPPEHTAARVRDGARGWGMGPLRHRGVWGHEARAEAKAGAGVPAMGRRCVCTTDTVRHKAEVQSKGQRGKLFSDMS